MNTTYFRGSKVNLTGKTETVHGGLFHEGVYAEGPETGQPVLVADRLVEQVRALDNPAVKMVSVRQEAAELAEAAGRKPCAERSHPADCPGGCELPPALVMRDTSGSSIMSGRSYYLLCPGGEFLLDAEGRIQRFEREQEALNAATAKGWKPIADSGLPRGREWAEAHDRVYTWKA